MAALGPTAECLAIDELASVLEGRRGDPARGTAEAHMLGCAYCRNEMTLLREFESPAIRPEERKAVDSIAAQLRKNSPAAAESWWQWLRNPKILVPALSFAMALIAVTVGLQFRHSTIQPYVPSANDVLRGQSVEVIGPVGDVAQPPDRLEWRPVAGASQYKIKLMEVDRTEVWSATLAQTSALVPQNVRSKLSPLKTLLWQVVAINGVGDVVADSGVQRFRVER